MARTCPKCGEFINGIIEESTHPCNGSVAVYKVPTDNEMREFFLEIGMPLMVFDSFKFAKPTETERVIYKDTSPYKDNND